MRWPKTGTLILIIIFLCTQGTFNAPATNPADTSHTQDLQPSHVINGIPYTAQTEFNYCYYACLTMALNFMGLNTSLDEVLFFGGVGYTHSFNGDNRLPAPVIYFNDFLNLFGVQENDWTARIPDPPSDENWTAYCTRLQDNITNDQPVMTMVYPFSLPSLRTQFAVDNKTWNILFPTGIHAVLVIGYNTTNQSVCYQDPNAGYYGDSRYGDHAWMTLSQLRTAVENCIFHRYRIATLNQTTPPLPRDEAAAAALQMNHFDLEGDSRPGFGVNATRQLCDWYSPENRTNTSELYEQQGGPSHHVVLIRLMRLLCSVLRPLKPNIFDILSIPPHDPFKQIAAGKNHAADYLNESPFLTWGKNESRLLRGEALLWNALSYRYQIFLRRGPFISPPSAERMMQTMERLMQDILTVEQTILADPFRS